MPSDDARLPSLDIALLLNNNHIRFARSSRRHRVGRARIITVLASHGCIEIEQSGRARLLWVGADWSGRMLEVVGVLEGDCLIVIHAMDARPKLIHLYAEGNSHGTS